MAQKQLLLVEGLSDKDLFVEFCRAHDFHTDVKVAPPREVGERHNTKQAAMRHLGILMPQLADGQLERLGLVVDADLAVHGGGFARTRAAVSAAVSVHGYTAEPEVLVGGGLVYPHNDGLPAFGLWIMPNNRDDGAVEGWIHQLVQDSERPLLQQAVDAVAVLENPKFRPVGRNKAEIATWLAWQVKPGEGLYYAIEGQLLNPNAPLYAGFRQWMERVFR